MVDFRTSPARYRHWRLAVDGSVATLTMDVDEQGGLVPGYELKLNSYDLGVDIELYDAVQRLRFECPEVKAVVLTSGKDKVFCAGANIRMLAAASHPFKVNFCKFTNETRNGIEDASLNSGQLYIAALNGTASGGGYELALACEHIMLVDDRSSAVSLPELPLLGVLPGTGGLTRVTDKRHVRRDLADYFATKSEGVAGKRAVQWKLVDEAVPRAQWQEMVSERSRAAAQSSPRLSGGGPGIELTPLDKTRTGTAVTYAHVSAALDHDRGVAEITVLGPSETTTIDDVHQLGDKFWTLAVTRELDDLILDLRTNELELGTWVLRTRGDQAGVLARDELLLAHAGTDWLANEIVLYLKRTLKRLDVTSRSLIALIEPGSCFAGSLLELALAADRSYMFAPGGRPPGDPPNGGLPAAHTPGITVGAMNLGPLPMGNGLTRLQTRFVGDPQALEQVEKRAGEQLEAEDAERLGLVTFAPDDIDWDDEVRIAVEERASFSPDALTGLEANYRFAGPETMETKIFGRLTAWQNWIFYRPNASGPDGALRAYGTGKRAGFDRKRVLSFGAQLRGEDPEQRELARRPAAAAGAGVVAAQLPDVVADHGTDAAHSGRVPAHGGQRRPRGLGALRPRADEGLPLGDIPGRAKPGPADRVRRAQGRARLAEGARGVPGRATAADRHPGRHRARQRRTAAQPCLHGAVALRHAELVPGQRGGGPSSVGDGVPAARLLRPGGPGGGRGTAAP
jgi:benzoyl-CoA-dihydrodiol lyase